MLDNTDYQILNELTQNSRMTMKELGQKVHLTGQATATRVAKLEDSGVIEGYMIKVNNTKLGYNIHAIINIYTKSLQYDAYLILPVLIINTFSTTIRLVAMSVI